LFSAVRRQLFGEPHTPDERTFEQASGVDVPNEIDDHTSSRLGALIVVLVPFAVAAWVVIGVAVYRALM
jgi:hypothetical protein